MLRFELDRQNFICFRSVHKPTQHSLYILLYKEKKDNNTGEGKIKKGWLVTILWLGTANNYIFTLTNTPSYDDGGKVDFNHTIACELIHFSSEIVLVIHKYSPVATHSKDG